MKKIVKLTESDLHRLIKESVKVIINESYNDDDLHMFNYMDAMSDRESESMSIKDIISELQENGYNVEEYVETLQPANWTDILYGAQELGFDMEEVKQILVDKLKADISWIEQSIDTIQNFQ